MKKISSEERGKRISEGLARMTPEAKKRMHDKRRPHRVAFMTGRRMPEESIRRGALKRRGRKVPEEIKEKLRRLYKGKPRPDFLREKNPNWKGGPKTYQDKLEKLAGRKRTNECEICGSTTKKICFDHDHKTGKFRGWICTNCNVSIGFARDDVGVLKKMIEYLLRST